MTCIWRRLARRNLKKSQRIFSHAQVGGEVKCYELLIEFDRRHVIVMESIDNVRQRQ